MNWLFAAAGVISVVAATAGVASLAQAPGLPSAVGTERVRASTTITGQPLSTPQPGGEVVISTTEIPAGGSLPMHKHPWPRFAYVDRGQLRVHYVEAGIDRVFGPGDAVIEAVDQWHEGNVVGDEPVRLIVIDQLPAGQTNVVRR